MLPDCSTCVKCETVFCPRCFLPGYMSECPSTNNSSSQVMLDPADRQVLATFCSICQFLAPGTPHTIKDNSRPYLQFFGLDDGIGDTLVSICGTSVKQKVGFQDRLMMATVLSSIRASSPFCRRMSSCFTACCNRALQMSRAD